MRKSEMYKIFAAIQVYYPTALWAANANDAMIEAWTEMLAPYPFEVVSAALKRHVVNSTYEPRVSDLLVEIKLLTPDANEKKGTLTPEQAWALVLMAVKNSAYKAQTEFNKLPEEIRRRVGSAEVLKSWAVAEDDGQTLSVARSNFLKSFGEDYKAIQMNELMPESVKRLMATPSDPVKELVERNTADPAEPIPTGRQSNSGADDADQRRAQKLFDLAAQVAQRKSV